MLISHGIPLRRIISSTWHSLFFSLLTCSAAFFINELFLSHYFNFPSFVPTILGTALAFFIGFNNNQAYDRWWEARKVWGTLVNDSRSWARSVLTYATPNDVVSTDAQRTLEERMIKRHIAFIYVLKKTLRKDASQEFIPYLSEVEYNDITDKKNPYNALLVLQAQDLKYLYDQRCIDGFQFISMNARLTSFCDEMGKSERIRNTVFPTTYHYYARYFIWIFIYSSTMTVGNTIGIWAIFFGTLLGYVFFTIQSIGQLLLDPFDPIPTGIPLDQISRNIEINLLEMLGERNLPDPVQSIHGEYIM
jgi:putative membrane protein